MNFAGMAVSLDFRVIEIVVMGYSIVVKTKWIGSKTRSMRYNYRQIVILLRRE